MIDAVAEAQIKLGWTQRGLASRAGLSHATVNRLLREIGGSTDLRKLERLAEVAGVRIDASGRAEVARPRQRDAAHALAGSYLQTRLEARRWMVEQEVEIGQGSARGWIDAVGYHLAERVVFIGEIKTEIDDAGAARRQLAWYEGEGWALARRRGWRPTRMIVALLLLFTIHNDLLVVDNARYFRQAFPTGADRLQRLIDDPAPMGFRVARGLALIDPRSRRTRWLRHTRVEGRSSSAPYRDYADFMERIEADRAARRRRARD